MVMVYVYNDETFYRPNPDNEYEEKAIVCLEKRAEWFLWQRCLYFRHSVLDIGTYLNSSYIKSSTIKAH